MESDTLIFFVNGQKVEDAAVDPRWTLLEYLRSKLQLYGAKLACGTGGCGACTVMLSKYSSKTQKIQHMCVTACLIPICYVHGHSVVTIEGIGSSISKLHPIQERLAKSHGSQCGFCSPGFVMSMYALLRNNPKPSYQQLEQQLQGNLCRCTGYRPIMEGFRSFLYQNGEPLKQPLCCGNDDSNSKSSCCQKYSRNDESNGTGVGQPCCSFNTESISYSLTVDVECAAYDPQQEIIFPPYIQLHPDVGENSAKFVNGNVKWFSPNSLEELFELRSEYPDASMVGGCNCMVQKIKIQSSAPSVYLSTQRVHSLSTIDFTDDGLKVGAAVTATELQRFIETRVKEMQGGKKRQFNALLHMITQYACQQTRNTACIGGLVMMDLSSADFLTILICLNTSFNFISKDRRRSVAMSTGQHPIDVIASEEILESITIPHATDDEYFLFYKQGVRENCSPAIVSASFKATFQKNSTVELLKVVYGEVAPRIWVLDIDVRKGKNRQWNRDFAEEVCFNLNNKLPEEIGHYKKSLALSLFFKYFTSVKQQLEYSTPDDHPENDIIIPRSSQVFQKVPVEQSDINPIGRPVVHTSAFKQVCGEAQYVADIIPKEGELHAAPVLSSCASADIEAIDCSKALAVEGVKGFFSAEDLSDSQNSTFYTETLFASKKVEYFGQLVGIVVAVNRNIAKAAAKLVEVKYKNHQHPILTLEEAIEKNSYLGDEKCLQAGNIESALKESENVIEGQLYQSGQYQLYLEPIAAVAVPKDASEMDIWVTAQGLSATQGAVTNLLKVPANHVTFHNKRVGGAFGGKELEPTTAAGAAAVAAKSLRKPVRFVLDRDENMKLFGGRNPYKTTYKVGFNNDGKLDALDITFQTDGGYSQALSNEVLTQSILQGCGSYAPLNVRLRGRVYKTNLPSNASFRGFGVPEGAFIIEAILDHVAQFLRKPPHQVRELNFIGQHHVTPYNQMLDGTNLLRCWEECRRDSQYEKKLQEVELFNRTNEWKKRGVALIPHTQGVGVYSPSFCFGGALVNIYTDGSVLVAHGGIEMGQGLFTKTIQVASTALGVPITKVHIEESSTATVPNAFTSGGSTCTDLYGGAVLDACKKLLARLEPVMKENPDDQWEDWVMKAYTERINLSATGFYRVPDMDFNDETMSGWAFDYYAFGTACTEVEIDCLTGAHTVLSCHIVMDVGESINPAIDIGQIEGAFMQGYGRIVMEQPLHSDEGETLSCSMNTYQIPSFSNMPTDFTVSLLRGSSNPRAVYSSKGVGEPPLCLSSSAYFAIKAAITAVRVQRGLATDFSLNLPATPDIIRLLCQDEFTNMAKGQNCS